MLFIAKDAEEMSAHDLIYFTGLMTLSVVAGVGVLGAIAASVSFPPLGFALGSTMFAAGGVSFKRSRDYAD
jgi:hypothetical protein